MTLTGLDGATEYEVYVQAACLDNEYSDWAGPLVFETPCSVIDVFPWTESFEGDICWTVAAISGINNWNLVQQNSSGNITPRTGAYMAEFRSSTEGDAALLISPTLDLSGLTTPELSFYFANENWFGDIDELGLLYRGNDEDNFISIDEVFFDTEHAQWTKVTIDLPNPSATYQIAFYGYSNWARGVNIDDVTIQEKVYNYVYENGMWSPEHPNVSAIGTDRITVVNGIATGEDAINSDLAIDAITIMSGATLEINSVLTLNGDLIVDGDLIFGSGPNFDGQLGFIGENATITGAVTVHRYMSENRAYRMVSSPVTTSDFIRDNWQEGINNLDYNNNPNPGYGTHITGSNYNLGFDVTATGNPSLFTVDISSQSFVAVPNTSATSMDAGDAFLMFVRGDRGIDLNDNSASGTTILRTKGMLFTGDKTQNYSVSAGDFVMFGNPYQSALDVEKVLGASSNVNSNHYYVYDPTFGEQGKYVTVDFVIGGEEGSEANQYLQPGQAAQFIVGGAGTVSLTIKEEHKEPGEHSATHRGAVIDNLLTVQLYTTENFSEGGKDHDSFRMLFDSSFSNDISQEDAVMPFNFNENLGINNGGTYLSIERRKMPVQDEVYQLYTQGYSHSDYTFKLTLNGVEDVSLYFEDRFTGAIERIEQGENTFAFNVDSNSSGSLAEDRFVIRADRPLHIDDKDLLHFNLYPNPIEDNSFYIQSSGFQGQSVEVTITDVTGKRFFHEVIETPSNKVFITTKTTLAAGVYFLNLKHQNGTSTIKLIKE